jgi:NADPH:quinone reductase-like Zn-dependent oxidoreductase
MFYTSIRKGKKAIFSATGLRKQEEKKRDLAVIRELIEVGQLKPVIDRRYYFKDMAEAHRYVEKGHKRGSVAILMEEIP